MQGDHDVGVQSAYASFLFDLVDLPGFIVRYWPVLERKSDVLEFVTCKQQRCRSASIFTPLLFACWKIYEPYHEKTNNSVRFVMS